MLHCNLFKDTSYLHVWGKNMQLLDVSVCNSANKPSFQNPTKSHFAQSSIYGKSAVSGFEKIVYLIAELQVRTSRSCRFLLFLPHKYQVSLKQFNLPRRPDIFLFSSRLISFTHGRLYAKRSLMSWVVVIPKEGRARGAAPALLLVSDSLVNWNSCCSLGDNTVVL